MSDARPARLLPATLLALAALAPAPPPPRDLPVTGREVPALASFDRLMTSFLRKHNLPGAALAVGRGGKVVYARGFGHTDRATKEAVQPESLFRIASVSKPITAAAVLQLAERGRLRLGAHVFDLLGLKAPAKGFDPRWKKVTVEHLLRHRGGWDRDKSFDPMGMSPRIVQEVRCAPPAMPASIIQFMLGQRLDFEPGTREAYSNFGYCLLGRVVEKASGQSYEQYVKQHVLAPLGVRRMAIGHTLTRAPGEVVYHNAGKDQAVMGPNLGKPVPLPYGAWCLEAMDAHGGWIASAPDLVRFAMAFDDPNRCKILQATSIKKMLSPAAGDEKKDAYYAMGWEVRPDQCQGKPNTWHMGLLDGTSTLLVRRCDGLSWAVLFNSSKQVRKEQPADAIDPLVHGAADAVKAWP
jgi:N-acyl-D-amino-acid deacylase